MGHGPCHARERGPGYVRRHQPQASTVPGGFIPDSTGTGACQVQFCSSALSYCTPTMGPLACIWTLCSFMSSGRTVWFFCNGNAHAAPKDHTLPRMHVTASISVRSIVPSFFLLRRIVHSCTTIAILRARSFPNNWTEPKYSIFECLSIFSRPLTLDFSQPLFLLHL
jgi:hypothetical protein